MMSRATKQLLAVNIVLLGALGILAYGLKYLVGFL
jgi:hypothetical protein